MFPDGMAENHVPLACLDEPSFTRAGISSNQILLRHHLYPYSPSLGNRRVAPALNDDSRFLPASGPSVDKQVRNRVSLHSVASVPFPCGWARFVFQSYDLLARLFPAWSGA